jgi:tRNA(Ile)-lysidine synthase
MVERVAAARGLRHRTLAWEGDRPGADVEAAARQARYRLLLRATREAGARDLLLAHHRDDQAETFLMRLSRGSGLFGLAAMRPSVRAGDVTILRPFLDIARSRLMATAAAAGLVPADDPMNRDPRYLRARIRRLMPLLAAEGFDPLTLAGTAARLRSAADAIEAAAGAALARHVAVDGQAMAAVDPAFFLEPAEVRQRALVRLLMAIGGEPYPPRLERLAGLERAMAGRTGGRFKRTLGGVVIEARGGRFVLYRELGREGLGEARLLPGRTLAWDHRFRIEAGPGLPEGLSVAALGEAGRLATGLASAAIPPAALAALPAIRRGTAILSVPTLGHGDAGLPLAVRETVSGRLAAPLQFPDFSGD